jgi:hypothetical protein
LPVCRAPRSNLTLPRDVGAWSQDVSKRLLNTLLWIIQENQQVNVASAVTEDTPAIEPHRGRPPAAPLPPAAQRVAERERLSRGR